MFAINPAEIDKSTAALEICRIENVDPSRVIVFGDRDNDSGLFRAMGYGVAMANATEKSKKAAKYVVSSNDDGGVAEFLRKVWDLE
jgi:hydroxymethylpyrimidine pyrophosphatase-like HAD family hydrolase